MCEGGSESVALEPVEPTDVVEVVEKDRCGGPVSCSGFLIGLGGGLVDTEVIPAIKIMNRVVHTYIHIYTCK